MIRLQEMVRFYIAWHNIPTYKIETDIGIKKTSIRRFLYEDKYATSNEVLLKIMDWAIQEVPDDERGIYIDPARGTRSKKPTVEQMTESLE